jgi:hypothetical protein
MPASLRTPGEAAVFLPVFMQHDLTKLCIARQQPIERLELA